MVSGQRVSGNTVNNSSVHTLQLTLLTHNEFLLKEDSKLGQEGHKDCSIGYGPYVSGDFVQLATQTELPIEVCYKEVDEYTCHMDNIPTFINSLSFDGNSCIIAGLGVGSGLILNSTLYDLPQNRTTNGSELRDELSNNDQCSYRGNYL